MTPCKLLLTYDVEGWAFHLEVQALAWFLETLAPGEFDITMTRGAHAKNGEGFDVVYSSAYYDLRLADHPKSCSQLSSHSFWDRPEEGWPGHLLRWKYLGLKNSGIVKRLGDYHPQTRLFGHMVNPETLSYVRRRRGEGFVVGFAGHVASANKGFKLIEEGAARAGAELRVADYATRIPPAEMPAFFHSLDAYICMSKREGGPRTGLEAMLCGAPLVTTRVGQVGDIVEDGTHALVVDRDAGALAAALARLKDDPYLGQVLAWNAVQLATSHVMDDGAAAVKFFRAVRDA